MGTPYVIVVTLQFLVKLLMYYAYCGTVHVTQNSSMRLDYTFRAHSTTFICRSNVKRYCIIVCICEQPQVQVSVHHTVMKYCAHRCAKYHNKYFEYPVVSFITQVGMEGGQLEEIFTLDLKLTPALISSTIASTTGNEDPEKPRHNTYKQRYCKLCSISAEDTLNGLGLPIIYLR